MGPRLAVDPATYEAASLTFAIEIAGRVMDAGQGLLDGLGGCIAMAGADPAGQSWARAYDEAAALTVGATADVINGCYQLAALLEQTGFNYGRAESSSTAGAVESVPDRMPYAGWSIALNPPPSAAGGTLAVPPHWWLIEQAVGYIWPGGHQDSLRAAAAAWTAGAGAIGGAALRVHDAFDCIEAQVTPEADDAMTACRAMEDHLWDLDAAYRGLAGACSDFAGHIDKAHSDVEHELVSLVEWTAGIQAAGGVFTFITAGLSEAAAQLAQVERIAATAAKVRSIIAHLIEMAGVVAQSISATTARVVQVSRNLKGLLGTRLSVATADTVEGLPQIAVTAERVAVGDLKTAAATRGPTLVKIGGPKDFDPHVLKGMTMDDLRASVPSNWTRITSKSGGGEVFRDPANAGRRIRIMPGYPADSRPDLITAGPYAVVSQNGDIVKVPLFGNPTLR